MARVLKIIIATATTTTLKNYNEKNTEFFVRKTKNSTNTTEYKMYIK